MAEVTKGRFGFHRGGSEHEPPTAAYIQIYVKSSTLSRAPDLAISGHLTTAAEIDEFVDDALAELERVRIDAKKELAVAELAQPCERAQNVLAIHRRCYGEGQG